VPFSELRLKDERVLQTPYWWAWGSPDDDVKRPLNVLTAEDAKRMIQATGNPFRAFTIARMDMFYEPGVVIQHTFTSTLYTRDASKPQVRVETTYFSTTYAIREVVTNSIVYRTLVVQGQGDPVHTDSPYARFRYVVEDYANDRMVGVNTNARGEVSECALIERAVLERPVTIWRMPAHPPRWNFQSQHRRENLLRLVAYNTGSRVVFEPTRLRPLYGYHVMPGYGDYVQEQQTWSFRFSYDAPIPDFLSSPACQADRSVRSGYPAALADLIGEDFPGQVRIARAYSVGKDRYLSFAIVLTRPLNEAAELARARFSRALNAALTSKQGRIYNYPAISLSYRSRTGLAGYDVLDIDAISLEPARTRSCAGATCATEVSDMNAIRAFFIFLLALAPAAPALAQRDDPDWVVYNPPKPISKYTWLDLDAKYPYGQPRLILSSDVALRLPTLFQRDFPPLPSNTRLPLHTAPDIPDLSKASWRVWRFGGFVADGLKVPTMESDRMYETNEVRTVTYRPLPARPNVPAIPHRAEGLTYGNLRIPVLNYSPDMVTGYPCPLSDERQDSPRVWLEVGGGRATGAAIIPDDPCITQRALDFAVYALSRASPDRSMRDFLAGLEEIRNRASPESYRLSDPAYVYRLFYLRKKEGPGWIAWYGRYTPAHGGLMHFLPTSEDKRLY